MTREDFINWLDRPLTEMDNKIIDTLLDMIKSYDKNVKQIEELMIKIKKMQETNIKYAIEDTEVLYED